MKQTITFEAAGEWSNGAFLLHLAIVMRQMRIEPLALAWWEPAEGSKVRRWTITLKDETRLDALLGAIAGAEGVERGRITVIAGSSLPPFPPLSSAPVASAASHGGSLENAKARSRA